MKSKWKNVKLGLMLFALPLMATAGATAHQLMVDGTPISINVETESVATSKAIGLARVHTVALNRNGAIEGRIASINDGNNSGISALKVYFVQNGKVVRQTVTNENGSFVATDIPEGAYSFVATGENGFAAYGVQVVADNTGTYDNVMEAAAVSPNFASVKKILNENLPQEVASEILTTQTNDQRIVGSNRVLLKDGKLQGSVVALLGDSHAVKGTYVHILQNQQEIAEVQADDAGTFMVADLEPGVYDFVAAGPSGFAAVSFEAVQEEDSVLADTDELPVSVEPGAIEPSVEPGMVEPGFIVADPITYQDAIPADIPFDAGYSDSLDVCMTCQQDAGFVTDQVAYAGESYVDPGYVDQGYVDQGLVYDSPIEYASEAVGCGCAAGGSCGTASNFTEFSSCNSCNACNACGGQRRGLFAGLRGGAGGGLLGGGLGRILLLGGLAGGIVAIADDDSDGNSPVNP